MLLYSPRQPVRLSLLANRRLKAGPGQLVGQVHVVVHQDRRGAVGFVGPYAGWAHAGCNPTVNIVADDVPTETAPPAEGFAREYASLTRLAHVGHT